jgi:IS5 family transposase
MKNYSKAVNQNKYDPNKIYSIYEPDVACIAKGKAYAKYEFGNKISILISKNSKIIVAVQSFQGNPYDGDTIEATINMASQTFDGYKPEITIGDLGYRGRIVVGCVKIIHPDLLRNASDPDVREKILKMLSSRSAIEPIFGHLKSDHPLGRNMLHGVARDGINAVISAAAFNFKKFARLEETKLTVAISGVYGKKPTRRPKRKTRGVPFCKPLDTPRLFPKWSIKA